MCNVPPQALWLFHAVLILAMHTFNARTCNAYMRCQSQALVQSATEQSELTVLSWLSLAEVRPG